MRQAVLICSALGVGLFLALALAEVGLRLYGYSSKLMYEPQPAYGWKLTANNRFSWWTDGESREIDVNSHGRRDRERSFDKPDGTCRIVVLGDSLMEGLQVAGQNTFSSVLETALRTDPSVAPAHVEVLNTGVSGYGTDNELLYFRNEGYRYAPDLVILGFTIGNDIRNNQPQLEIINTGGEIRKPQFRLVNGALQPFDDRRPIELRSRATRFKLWLNRHLRSYALMRDTRDKVRYAWRQRRAAQLGQEHAATPIDLDLFRTQLPEQWQHGWEITDALLATLNEEVRARGARLVVMAIPTYFQVDRREWDEMVGSLKLSESDWDLEQPNRTLAAILNKHGVELVDLRSAFVAQAQLRPEEQLYTHGDRHWNERGHQLAARVMQSHLPAGWCPLAN